MSRTAYEAARSGGDAATNFKGLHFAVTDGAGKMRPVTDIFLDIAAALSKMEDGTAKTAVISEVFGLRAGPRLAAMLNLGRDGITNLLLEAKRLGVVLSEEDAAAAHDFEVAMVKLHAAVQGLGNTIMRETLPALNLLAANMVASAEESGSKWQAMASIAGTLAKSFLTAFAFIQSGFDQLGAYIKNLNAGLVLVLEGIASGAESAAKGRFAEAAKALKDGWRDANIAWSEGVKENQRIWNEYVKGVDLLWNPSKAMNAKKGAGGGPAPDTKDFTAAMATARASLLGIQAQIAKDSGDTVDSILLRYEMLLAKVTTIFSKFPQLIRAFPLLPVEIKVAEAKEIELQTQKALEGATKAIEEWEHKHAKDLLIGAITVRPPAAMPGLQPDRITALQKLPPANLPYQLDNKQLEELAKFGTEAFKSTATAAELYAAGLKDLDIALNTVNPDTKTGYINQQTYNRSLADLKEKLAGGLNSMLTYEKELQRIKDSLKEGAITADQAALATARLKAAQQNLGTTTDKLKVGLMAGLLEYKASLGTLSQIVGTSMGTALSGLQRSFSTFFSSLASGTKSIGQAFVALRQGILSSVGDAIGELISKIIMLEVVIPLLEKVMEKFGLSLGDNAAAQKSKNADLARSSAALAAAGTLAMTSMVYMPPWPEILSAIVFGIGQGYAALAGMSTGGLVSGIGSGDTVPKLLTPGEFVMTRGATRALGVSTLDALNQGRSSPGLQAVAARSALPSIGRLPSASTGGGGTTTHNYYSVSLPTQVQALDSEDAAEYFRRNSTALARAILKEIKRKGSLS